MLVRPCCRWSAAGRSHPQRRRIHGGQPRLEPVGHAGVLALNTLAPYILTALIHRPARLVCLSSAWHRGGEGPLPDLDWTKRAWDPAKAYAESKLQVVALAFAVARLWPQAFSNAVDPGWVRTKMSAPVDLDTGQRTQTWLAVSDEPAAMVSGR
jgi:NAD(P)-dependent dehydrogenase (short-subunit alcohol dehydrogenase family)